MKVASCLTLLLLTCVAYLPVVGAQQTTAPKKKAPAKPCVVEFEGAEELVAIPQGADHSIIYLGGNVRFRCVGQNIHLRADSAIAYDGYDNVTLIGSVHYNDDDYDVTSDTLRRYKETERVELRGRVVVKDLNTKSVLTAPAIDYFRQVPKVNDVAKMLASGGAEATIYPKTSSTGKVVAKPYHVVANRLYQEGPDHFEAFGQVLVERDSLTVTGDSVKYYSTKEATAYVWGAPGKVVNRAHDSATVSAKQIRVDLAADESVKEMRAFLDVVFLREGAVVTSDTMIVNLKDNKLTGLQAWSRGHRSHMLRDGYDAWGDSLVIVAKDDILQELRLFRQSKVEQPRDSAGLIRSSADSSKGPNRDWLTGDRITVFFMTVDSAGTSITVVRLLDAQKMACSLASRSAANRASSSVTYSCADNIKVSMKEGLLREVHDIRFRGNLRGAILQPDPTVRPPRSGGGHSTP